MRGLALLLLAAAALTVRADQQADEPIDKAVYKARIEVKQFIYEDIPMFHNVIFKAVPGAPPEAVLLNKLDQVVERIPLETLSRKKCNALLKNRGFFRKEKQSDPVPDQYQEGPYGSQHQEL